MIDRIDVSAYTIPTDAEESDGTLTWESTTLIVVEAHADGETGLGYSYNHSAAAWLVDKKLSGIVEGENPLAVEARWDDMQHATRNMGRQGIAASAISAVDTALWDLKARLLNVSLVDLLGPVRESIPAYGSGGFTSYSIDRLKEQFGRWCEEGLTMMKMKVGAEPDEDVFRVEAARATIGEDAQLFVDANGAYDRKQALYFAEAFADLDVNWFEEPVSSDDVDGLRLLRDQGPPGLEVTAGEYGWDLFHFRRLLEGHAVDVVQPDATRCGGVTGFMQAAVLCRSHGMPLSAHTAPTLHAHLCCAARPARHAEYFHDHVRIETMLFDGALEHEDGHLLPNRDAPGMGLTFRREEAEEYRVL